MGAIAAVVSKKNENVVPKVVAMLRELTHRGTCAHGIATHEQVVVAESIEKLPEEVESCKALGHNLSCILRRDLPQPVQGEGFSLVFEGRLFPPPNTSEVEKVVTILKQDPQRNARYVIEGLNGSYVFAIASSSEVIAGRDTLGTTPLYYGENEAICAIASERKALWALGTKNVRSFAPGNLARIKAEGFSFKQIKTITQPPLKSLDMGMGAKYLQDLLLESAGKRVSDVEEVAVAFSGGLDSSIVAVLAGMCGATVHLISVGLENRSEVRYAVEAAEALGLPIYVQTYTTKDVERVLPKVLWLMEESGVVKVGVAVPLYWTAEIASKFGHKVVLSGQGSDELFGGYRRYLKDYAQSGVLNVQRAMCRDVASSYKLNFQRDNQVCSAHNVELRLPFADHDVTQFSLSLPLSLKINSTTDPLRKRVLRRVAQNLGLPNFIANKQKKAVQYSTGVDKALRMLARRKGLTLRGMLKSAFREVYPNKKCG